MKTYTNKENIERYLLLDIDESFNTQINSWIDAMSLYIDKYCNREFDDESGDYEEPPSDIVHACTVLVSSIILGQTNQAGEVKSEKIGDYQVTYKDEEHKSDVEMAHKTLQQYRIHVI
jgi:hypothetical protein